MPGSRGPREKSAGFHDLSTYFIAATANSYSTMHYDISRRRSSSLGQPLDSTPEYPGCGASPACMQQADSVAVAINQVDRDAVGHSNEQHQPWCACQMAIQTLQDAPSIDPLVPGDSRAMHLVRHGKPAESGFRRPECAPAGHDLAHRLRRPESKVERFATYRSSGRDACDNTKPIAPARDFETRYRTRERSFSQSRNRDVSHPSARFQRRARAVARRSARTPARSAPRCK